MTYRYSCCAFSFFLICALLRRDVVGFTIESDLDTNLLGDDVVYKYLRVVRAQGRSSSAGPLIFGWW